MPEENVTEQTTSAGPTNNDDLFGDTEGSAQTTEETEASPEANTETEEVEQGETEQPEETTETIEEDEPYALPDEQKKEFPLEEIVKFGKARYGYTQEEIEGDPRLQRTLKDKLNSDILIENNRKAAEEAEAEEPTLEEEPEATEPTQEQLDKQYQVRVQALEQMASQVTDPRMAKEFHKEFMEVWDAKKVTPEKQAERFTHVMTKWGGNLLATMLPHLLYSKNPQTGLSQFEQAVDAFYPGMRGSWEQGIKAQVWNEAKGANKELNLPNHGTPEWKTWFDTQSKRFPQVARMKFEGANAMDNARMQYETLIALASGKQTDPATAKRAVETGKKQAVEAQRKRDAGRLLASGQSKKSFAPVTTKNDDIFGEGVAEYRRREKF